MREGLTNNNLAREQAARLYARANRQLTKELQNARRPQAGDGEEAMKTYESITRTISPTGYSLFCKCPQKWAYRYLKPEGIQKPEDPQTPDLLAGNGLHAVIESAIKQHLADGQVDLDQCIKHGLAKVAELVNRHGLSTGDVMGDLLVDKGELLDSIMERVARAGRWFVEREFQFLRPVAAEVQFEIEIPGSDSGHGLWTMNGKIDCIQKAEVGDGLILTDWKLASKAPSVDKADRSTQLSLYAMYHWLQNGVPPDALQLYFIIDSARCHSLIRETRRTEADCSRWLKRLAHTCRSIDSMIASGHFPAADPETLDYGKPVCSNGRCTYFDQCPHGGLYGI